MLCLTAAALTIALPLHAFTLAWTHSIEKIRWEEDYQLVSRPDGSRLLLTEARIRGQGAGMEVPEGALLRQGVWHYRPQLEPLPELLLSRSAYTPDYELCWDGMCRPMQLLVGPPGETPLRLAPCPGGESRRSR